MRHTAKNLALLVVSVSLAWIAVETLFAIFLYAVPLRLHAYLREIVPLAQSSKASTHPKGDWIALAGDSYAAGNGDWLLRVGKKGNPAFHSAHVINRITGRDVLTLAQPSTGNVRGFVIKPLLDLARIGATKFHRIDPPSTFVLYFFSGNDLYNNLRFLRLSGFEHGQLKFQDFKAHIDRVLNDFTESLFINKTIFFDFFAAKFALRLVDGLFNPFCYDVDCQLMDYGRVSAVGQKPNGINLARVGGKIIALGDMLQGPAIEATGPERVRALRVTDHALRYLVGRFPDTRVLLVYIPSVLAVYDLAVQKVTVWSYKKARAIERPSAEFLGVETALCRAVATIAARRGVGFMDSRKALTAAARENPIHGPRDWGHLNERGHKALGNAVAKHLMRKSSEAERC